MPKKKPGKRFPPCPFPEGGVPVRSKEGNYWRRRRGSLKPADLNSSFLKNAEAAKIASPAAKRLVLKLYPFLRGLFPGRLIARLSGRFIKSLYQHEVIQFSLLDQFDFQQEFPFDKLVKADYRLSIEKNVAKLAIPVYTDSIERLNTLVTDYYFEMILLYGDITKDRGLRIESVESSLYSYKYKGKTTCNLELVLPAANKPWMILLKINSHEGNEVAAHGKHYGLKVIRVKDDDISS
jgi:hypothetical protein